MAQRSGSDRRVIGTIVGGGEGVGFHREWVVLPDRSETSDDGDDEAPR